MKNIKYFSFFSAILFIVAFATGCSKNSDEPLVPPIVSADPDVIPPMSPDQYAYIPLVSEPGSFAKGADVSQLTEYEAMGEKFYNSAGLQMELMELLRDWCGINAIRLKVWVNPADGWNDIYDVLVKSRRARALGLRLMIDFHFSDTWADPGRQKVPAAWKNLTFNELKTAMSDHVVEMLTLLKDYDIEPEWVQIGNETTAGMLWDYGALDNGDNFARLIETGYNAVKSVFADAKVIVHLDKGNDNWRYKNVFDKLKAYGAPYDMIGMSLYPEREDWQTVVADCMENIDALKRDYGKPVMICEIGYDYRWPDEAEQMLQTVIDGALERDVKGIFWWEPETPESVVYDKGAFQNGKPTSALNPFTQF